MKLRALDFVDYSSAKYNMQGVIGLKPVLMSLVKLSNYSKASSEECMDLTILKKKRTQVPDSLLSGHMMQLLPLLKLRVNSKARQLHQ